MHTAFTRRRVASSLALLTALAAPAHARDLKMSTPAPDPHIFTQSANHLDEVLSQGESGLGVKVFPGNKLGDVPTVLSLLRSGAVELAIVPVGDLAQLDDSFYGWFLPYEFDTLEQAGAAAGLEPAVQMLERLESQGIVGLGYLLPGQRHVLSKSPIDGPEDLKGLKIRSFPNDIFRAWWSDFGAAPTALPLPEIMPSLITGVVDAVDVDLDIVFGLKMHKQAPYLTLTNHMAFPGALLASKTWWDSLDPADRDTLAAAVGEVEAWAIDRQVAGESRLLDELEADGAIINRIDTAPFEAHAGAVSEPFLDRDPLVRAFADAVAAGE